MRVKTTSTMSHSILSFLYLSYKPNNRLHRSNLENLENHAKFRKYTKFHICWKIWKLKIKLVNFYTMTEMYAMPEGKRL